MVPVGLFLHNSIPLLSAFLNKYIHIKIILLFSLCCVIGCHLILYYFRQLYFIIGAMALHGLGNGLMYFQGMRNCWGFFPNNRGLITGIYASSFGISSFLFTILADSIINPEKKSTVDGEYPPDVAKRVPKFIFIVIIIFSSLSFVSFLLIFQHKEKKEVIKSIDQDLDPVFGDETLNKIIKKKEPVSQALLSGKFQISCAFTSTLIFFGFLVTNTQRGFGSDMKISQKILSILSPSFAALNAAGRIIWGMIYDKFGFFYPYVIICSLQTLCSIALYYSGKYGISYLIVTLLSCVSFSGHVAIFPPLITHSFGLKNSGILIGVIGYYIALSTILGPVFCSLLLRDSVSDYLKVYLLGTGFTIIAFMLLPFLGKEPFKYRNTQNDFAEEATSSAKLLNDTSYVEAEAEANKNEEKNI